MIYLILLVLLAAALLVTYHSGKSIGAGEQRESSQKTTNRKMKAYADIAAEKSIDRVTILDRMRKGNL